MKIGIIGLGFVGGALQKYFLHKRVKTLGFDKFKKMGSPVEVNQAETIFICVPTPYRAKQGFDISAVLDAVSILVQPKIIVIKSSVTPGTTEKLQKQFPQHKFLFNPEFLTEKKAYYDLTHPDRQILGWTQRSKSVAKKVLNILPKSYQSLIIPSQEAEMIKYMANAFLALKVVYANQFADLCKKLKINYSVVAKGVGLDKRIGLSHLNILEGGYKGYGGSCFPKDVNSIIQLAKVHKVDLKLLRTMRELNKTYLKQSGLTEEYFLNNLHKSNGKN
jgi:UDPglucose 6-dehydrogenase